MDYSSPVRFGSDYFSRFCSDYPNQFSSVYCSQFSSGYSSPNQFGLFWSVQFRLPSQFSPDYLVGSVQSVLVSSVQIVLVRSVWIILIWISLDSTLSTHRRLDLPAAVFRIRPGSLWILFYLQTKGLISPAAVLKYSLD